ALGRLRHEVPLATVRGCGSRRGRRREPQWPFAQILLKVAAARSPPDHPRQPHRCPRVLTKRAIGTRRDTQQSSSPNFIFLRWSEEPIGPRNGRWDWGRKAKRIGMVFPADPLGVRAQCYWLLPPPPEPPLPPAPPEPPLAPAPPAPPAPAPLAPAPPAPAPESLAPVAPAAPPVPVAPGALAPDPEEVVAPPPAEDPLVIVGEFV